MASSTRSRLKAALVTLALLALSAALLTVYFHAHQPGPGAVELTVVDSAVQPGGPFDAPPAPLGPDLPAGPWHSRPLPHQWPRSIVPQADTLKRQADVHWFAAPLPPPATAGSAGQPPPRHVYLARWQTIGTIALYADDRLVYQSHADLVWNGYNHPLLVPLDAPGEPPARLLRIRIASQVGAGGALTPLWLGSQAALQPLHDARQMVQVLLPEYANVAVLGLAGFALAVWLKRPRDSLYLLFTVFSVVFALRGLQYQLGLKPLPVPSEWFSWMSVNSHNVASVAWYYFITRLGGHVPAWPGRVLMGVCGAGALVTLPVLSGLPLVEAVAPLSYLVCLGTGLLAMGWLAGVLWRQASPDGIAASVIGIMDFALAGYDLTLVSYTSTPSGIYTTPLMALTHQAFFAYVLLGRHLAAIEGVERSNLVLGQRLRQREAELSASHEQLRAVQEREAVQRERQRLMQDLHDGMGSQLFSALRVAEAGQLDEQQMQTVLRECIDDLKLTVDSLEPVEADLLLLLATLRYRWAPRLKQAGLQVDWQVGELPPLPWLDPRSALHILRILQEAFSNAVQHAGATRLRVATETDGHGVAVLVEDDGRGFGDGRALLPLMSPSPLPGTVPGQGRGLGNMAQRAHSVGGRVSWQALANGTQLRLWLPLQRSGS